MVQLSKKLEKLKPLLGVMFFVVFSTLTTAYFIKPTTMELGKLFMSLFFLTFGSFKLYNLEGFIEAFKEYDLLAEKSSIYARTYPFLEVSLGILYSLSIIISSKPIEIIIYSSTLVIMGLGAIGVLNAIKEGRNLKCACLGNVFNVPMTTVTLLENLGMALMAAIMLSATI